MIQDPTTPLSWTGSQCGNNQTLPTILLGHRQLQAEEGDWARAMGLIWTSTTQILCRRVEKKGGGAAGLPVELVYSLIMPSISADFSVTSNQLFGGRFLMSWSISVFQIWENIVSIPSASQAALLHSLLPLSVWQEEQEKLLCPSLVPRARRGCDLPWGQITYAGGTGAC